MSQTWTYRQDQELPSFAANWVDGSGVTLDLSAHTFRVRLVNIVDGTVGLSKTTDITGAATSPNLVVAWAAGDLNIEPGSYRLHVTATLAGNDRLYAPGQEPTIIILPAVTGAAIIPPSDDAGVAAGGNTGDLLTKVSAADFDTSFVTRAALAADVAWSGLYAPLELHAPAPTGVAATDGPAIQALLDTARLAGGGVVTLRSGTYAVTIGAHPVTAGYYCALTIGTNTTLRGAGATIKLAANQTQGNDVSGSSAVILNRNLAAGGDERICIEDLTVDGDAGNQTHTHAGIGFARVRACSFVSVRVKNCRGTATSGTNETFFFDVSLSTDCLFDRCEAIRTAGSTATGFSANSSSNIKWVNCVGYGMNVAHGFTHNTCQNLQYVSCHAFLNTQYGFNSEASVDVIYTNCISGGDSTLAATYPYSSGTTLGNVGPGVVINSSTRVQLIGVISRHNQGNGIYLAGTSSGVIVGGEVSSNTFGGLAFDTASLGLWRCVGGPINFSNGTPQYLAAAATPVFGNVTAPSVPATTVVYTSIYPQDATVYVTGGTVTAIAVGGTATGLTGGTFKVPAGSTITLTYSSAPTWKWFLD